jgi:hypothetical protein
LKRIAGCLKSFSEENLLKSFHGDLTKKARRKDMKNLVENRTEEKNVWNNILQSVEKRLNKQIFDAWFRPIQFESV